MRGGIVTRLSKSLWAHHFFCSVLRHNDYRAERVAAEGEASVSQGRSWARPFRLLREPQAVSVVSIATAEFQIPT